MRLLDRRWVVAGIVTGVLFSMFAPAVDAQDRRRQGRGPSYAHTRNSVRLRKVFAPAVAKVHAATVRVLCDGEVVAMGTVVGREGLVLTKASELEGKEISIAFGVEEGRHTATVLGTDEPNDLALLRVGKEIGRNLACVQFAVENETRTGSFVVSAAPVATPLAYGVMSVARHARKAQVKLGVYPEQVASGMRLTRIVPSSPAAEAGLKPGDIVTAIDGEATKDRAAFSAAIRSHEPGSTMKLAVLRDGKRIEVVAEMAVDDDRHGPITSQERSRLWGPLSRVRIGFEQVIQHDTVIRPEHCGGPLCNLKGQVVGINISRVGRFETLALTSKVVVASIARILKTKPRKQR